MAKLKIKREFRMVDPSKYSRIQIISRLRKAAKTPEIGNFVPVLSPRSQFGRVRIVAVSTHCIRSLYTGLFESRSDLFSSKVAAISRGAGAETGGWLCRDNQISLW
jgi:hypothetical protein